MELASDHKEFATALAKTKLAEMTGKVKIVPVVAPPPRPPVPPAPSTTAPSQTACPVSNELAFPRGLEASSVHVRNNIHSKFIFLVLNK